MITVKSPNVVLLRCDPADFTLLSACATSPPEQVDNVCDIFSEKSGWYQDAKESRVALECADLRVDGVHAWQESRFVATAKPPRKKFWGCDPGAAAVRRLRLFAGQGQHLGVVSAEHG
jgi:hypothetical protein